MSAKVSQQAPDFSAEGLFGDEVKSISFRLCRQMASAIFLPTRFLISLPNRNHIARYVIRQIHRDGNRNFIRVS